MHSSILLRLTLLAGGLLLLAWPSAGRADTPQCRSVTEIVTRPSPPAANGTIVEATAVVACDPGVTPQFRWWIQTPAGFWYSPRDWSTDPTFVWDTHRRLTDAGLYRIAVWVRALGSTSEQEANLSVPYELKGGRCITYSLATVGTQSPQPVGTVVTGQAATQCTTGTTPEFRWWIQSPTGTWSVARDWAPSNAPEGYAPLTDSFDWNTQGVSSGTYRIGVWVRAVGSSVDNDANLSIPFVLTGPCRSVALTASPPAPSASGRAITFTAAPECAGGAVEYRWWFQPPGTGWSMVRDWSSGNAYVWNAPAELLSATYRVGVWVRAAGSTAGNDANVSMPYEIINGGRPCTDLALSTNLPSPQPVGAVVRTTAVTTCPAGVAVEYRWWVQDTTGQWSMKQDYSAQATFDWPTGGLPAGTYRIGAWVRSVGSTAPNDLNLSVPFQLT